MFQVPLNNRSTIVRVENAVITWWKSDKYGIKPPNKVYNLYGCK